MIETIYLGRDNEVRRVLTANGQPLSAQQQAAVTRVVVRVGDVCLDTDVAMDPIEYVDGVVTLKLGLSEELKPGMCNARLTVYDQANPNGLAFGDFALQVVAWGVCGE